MDDFVIIYNAVDIAVSNNYYHNLITVCEISCNVSAHIMVGLYRNALGHWTKTCW